MKSYSNTYIFIFSAVMVIIVAALLSGAAITLKPFQKKNIEINKKQNILTSINIESTADNAEKLYAKYIKESFTINVNGKKNQTVDAFTVDMKFLWRFAPGSDISIVWKNAIYTNNEDIINNVWDNWEQTLDATKLNSISFKILYYLDYQRIKRN